MPTTIRLDPNLEKRLEALAKRTGRTKAYYLRQAIEEHLEDLEDYYLAADVIERLRRGEERTYSLEEVEHELGLDN